MKKSKIALPTVSGLKLYQSQQIACEYLKTENWTHVCEWAVESRLFDTSRSDTSYRYVRHLVKIINTLENDQIGILASGDYVEQLSMLWLGFCKAFPIVGSFAKDVIHEKYVSKDFILSKNDFKAYLAVKSDSIPELKDVGDSTRSKLQSVVFGNLREVGYISYSGEIQTAMLSAKVINSIDNEELSLFPFQEVSN